MPRALKHRGHVYQKLCETELASATPDAHACYHTHTNKYNSKLRERIEQGVLRKDATNRDKHTHTRSLNEVA